MRKIIIGVALIIIGILLLVFTNRKPEPVVIIEPEPPKTRSIIGESVLGKSIEVYTYGNGDKKILFVGGIHGGYEWNSISLANEVIDYFERNPSSIPLNITIAVIPNLNPDGVATTSFGRFNANKVDLNRNFDCKWQPTSMWRGEKVSAGTKAFSEPETLALKNFVTTHRPDAVVFWHSQGNAVYASECEGGILPVTLDLMNLYSKASGYKAIEKFEGYAITGDAEGWLASIGVPAITVELKTHTDLDLAQNLAGVKALLLHFGQE